MPARGGERPSGEAAQRTAYRILERKRAGQALRAHEIAAVVSGAVDGSWSDAQVGAFLMASAIRGLTPDETSELARSMTESGERWEVASAVPGVVDKHSTGGVGDKVSMLLAPILAACGLPFAKLTAGGLGHTGGTADKLRTIPGLELEMDRDRCLALLEEASIAIGVASESIAPADRRLYALRDLTATVDCRGLVASSILAKKLALGASSLVFDVKSGSGAIFPDLRAATELAELLVRSCEALGRPAVALVTDMSQPLGRWAGHGCEVREVHACLSGEGCDPRLLEVVFALGVEVARRSGTEVSREGMLDALESGRALDAFRRWAAAQGAQPGWLESPCWQLAPEEVVAAAPRSGRLAGVDTRELGMLLLDAGRGAVHPGVSLRYEARLGERIEAGQELARLYVPMVEEGLRDRLQGCFSVRQDGEEPELIHAIIRGDAM